MRDQRASLARPERRDGGSTLADFDRCKDRGAEVLTRTPRTIRTRLE